MRILVTVICLAALSLQSGGAAATEVQTFTVAELGDVATTVMRGIVQDTRAYWNDERTKIFTEVAVVNEETYKGQAVEIVRILQLGGTVDNVHVTVHGALGWTPGEEVLLFLEPFSEGRFVVTGLSQGKFNLERDPATQAIYVARPGDVDFETGLHAEATRSKTAVAKAPLDLFLAEALGQDWQRSRE
jgi:hypothetical protein